MIKVKEKDIYNSSDDFGKLITLDRKNQNSKRKIKKLWRRLD